MPKTFRIGESVEFEGPQGKERGTVTDGCGTGVTKIFPLAPEPDLPLSFPAAAEATHPAAVREGGSLLSFPGKAGIPLH